MEVQRTYEFRVQISAALSKYEQSVDPATITVSLIAQKRRRVDGSVEVFSVYEP